MGAGEFFAGWLAGNTFFSGLLENKKPIPNNQRFFFVTIRMEKNCKLDQILAETIKENFSKDPKSHEIELINHIKKEEIYLDVHLAPKNQNIKPVFRFPLCFTNEHRIDSFFCISLKTIEGIPVTQNISLLRALIKKLKDKNINFEIW